MSEVRVVGGLISALPFWLSLSLVPVVMTAAWFGGWTLLLIPIYGLIVMSLLDGISGLDARNPDPQSKASLFWYKLLTWIWPPIQIGFIYGALWWVCRTDHLSGREGIYLMLGVGVVTGVVGIVHAHELMHQKNRWERFLGEFLMTSVLYGHFVTEHLAVHHRYVGTPRDAVTARYNESFYRFFVRVLFGSFVSAWTVEADRLRKTNRPVLALANPFWRYLGGGALFLALAFLVGGWTGVTLYLAQAFVAIIQLEQINYVEHYGLVRKKLPNGKYEPVAPRHSWNSSHMISNYLLINLQRHSDHHVKPDRRYPLLQTYDETQAPQLPFGYPLLVFISYNPWIWRKMMNPRVRRWRSMYYPEVLHWQSI